MVADGADVGSLLANDDMTAVGALPDDVAVAREDQAFLYKITSSPKAVIA